MVASDGGRESTVVEVCGVLSCRDQRVKVLLLTCAKFLAKF